MTCREKASVRLTLPARFGRFRRNAALLYFSNYR